VLNSEVTRVGGFTGVFTFLPATRSLLMVAIDASFFSELFIP
jgi:hypothetical protein